MKIFITGSTGFVGQNLVKFYQQYSVFEYKRGMILLEELKKFDPDLVINCAAEIYDTENMWAVNVILTKQCLQYCIENQKQMIQLGSSSEYGTVSRPTKELDPIQLESVYAGTKGIATLMCQTAAAEYQTDVVILRPYSPYGPGERQHRLFPALWRAFKLNRPMDLVMGVHDFLYIDDFVSAVDCVLNSKDRQPGEIINISSGQQYSNSDVLAAFQTVTGKQAPVNIVNKFVTPATWCADISHIKQKYGWQPCISLEQGIKLFLEKADYE